MLKVTTFSKEIYVYYGQILGFGAWFRGGRAYLAGLVLLYENSIHAEGTGACGQTEYEWMCGRGSKVLYAVDDVVSNVGARSIGRVPDDEPHGGLVLKGCDVRDRVAVRDNFERSLSEDGSEQG